MSARLDEPFDPPASYEGAAFADLTGRARIRDAALQHFADEGYERATVRAIARTAGVSPGLLRHHYGSKEALRTACDEYVFDLLHHANTKVRHDPSSPASAEHISRRFGRYIARALAEATTPSGAAIFDEMVTMTERWLPRADDAPAEPPTIDRRTQAALLTAMAIGPTLLHDHVSRTLGTDMLEPDGERLVALALLDIYSHRLLDQNVASAAEQAFAGHRVADGDAD